MHRRRYLRAVSGFGTITLPGCSIPSQPQTLTNPTTEHEGNGETHLYFRTDSSRVGTISVQPGREYYAGPGGAELPIDIAIAHADRTTITSITLKLRTLPEGSKPPAEVALITPFGTPNPPLELYTDPIDGGSILSIPNAEAIGTGTVTFEFFLSSIDSSTTEMELDATIELTEQGPLASSFTLSSLTIISLPTRNPH